MKHSTHRLPSITAMLVASSLSFRTVSAFAQPTALETVDLTWHAGTPCPSEGAVRAEVARILGASIHPHKRVSAVADVRRIAVSRWRAVLTVRTEETTAERTFDAETCEAIASATALIAALAVDERATAPSTAAAFGEPSSTELSALPPSSPTPTEPVTPAEGLREKAAPRPKPPPAISPARREAKVASPSSPAFIHRELASLSAAIDTGTLPGPGLGVEAAGGILFTRSSWGARAEVAGAYWLSQSTTARESSKEGGSFSLLTLAFRACAEMIRGRVNVGPCFGGEIDHVRASSFGTNVPLDGAATWGAFSGGGMLALGVTDDLFLRLRAEALFPFARPRFVVEEPAAGTAFEVHRAAPAAARATVGLELHFF